MFLKIAAAGLVLEVTLAAFVLLPRLTITENTSEAPVQWASGSKKAATVMQDAVGPKTMQVAVVLSKAKVCYGSDGGAVNAALAAREIDGIKLKPGEIFSFNSTVGPRTEARGFVQGTSVMRTDSGLELVPDIGGGVCRTATALHKAVKSAGLEVVEHHRHGLPVSYAPPGEDAAVAWPALDYRFKNNGDRAVLVKAAAGKDCCEVEIWGLSPEGEDG